MNISCVTAKVKLAFGFWKTKQFAFMTNLSMKIIYEEDKDDIEKIMQLENKMQVLDKESGVIMLHKSLKDLQKSNFINKVFNQDYFNNFKIFA